MVLTLPKPSRIVVSLSPSLCEIRARAPFPSSSVTRVCYSDSFVLAPDIYRLNLRFSTPLLLLHRPAYACQL